eukprot:CAMPEP_0114247158 /NCGR_PEP_ID=MMETSP0058-20121206/12871_1 /TAXON_ID=36894 /ORGANISM="Pyramimonas parkeae, CCMP726" /LENGTH=247 /DNA_ID=CAMNT_0001360441 /DNA_START=368 /DNA_END=1111 /DNA_ORIENTATION=+
MPPNSLGHREPRTSQTTYEVTDAEPPAQKKGYAIFDVEGNTTVNTMHEAAEAGDVRLMQLFARKRKFDIEERDRYGRTALMWACDSGMVDATEMLLRLGAKVEAIEPHTGRSAMHWAARSGSGGCVRALADCGADVCKPDKFGLTPLYLALHNGHEMNSGAPKVLMELGARWEGTSVKNLKGLTPEDMKAAGLDNSDEIFQSSTIKAGGSDDPANEPGLEEGIARVELKDDPAQNNNAGEISAPESS